jgi:hypothetical protein
LNLRDKIRIAGGYKNTNFFEADSIGVLARGPSLRALSRCYKDFHHCFLAGEFNNALDRLGPYLINKDIVLSCMRDTRYRTSRDRCEKYNIHNIQVPFYEYTKEFKELFDSDFFSDLHVVGRTRDHYEFGKKTYHESQIFSTGMAGIFHAAFFSPKKIYILGIDFYNRQESAYFAAEDHDDTDDSNMYSSVKRWRWGMIKNLRTICSVCKNTEFIMYTTFNRLKSKNNLKVYHV